MINEMNGHFWMMWMKTKKFEKNMKKFGKVFGKVLKKLGLNLMMICH